MSTTRAARTVRTLTPAATTEQRVVARTPVSFGLMYSGVTDTDVIMGDGTVVDLSPNGLGIRGNHAVTPGMDLTLFLYLPDQEDPLFVMQACVAWVRGHRFGVRIQAMRARERQRLQAFLHDHTQHTTVHQRS